MLGIVLDHPYHDKTPNLKLIIVVLENHTASRNNSIKIYNSQNFNLCSFIDNKNFKIFLNLQ